MTSTPWLALRVGNTIHALTRAFSQTPVALCGVTIPRRAPRTNGDNLRWCRECADKARTK